MSDETNSDVYFFPYPKNEEIDVGAFSFFKKEHGKVVYTEGLEGMTVRFGLICNQKNREWNWMAGSQNSSIKEFSPVISYLPPHKLGIKYGDRINKDSLVYVQNKTYKIYEDYNYNTSQFSEVKCVQTHSGKPYVKRSEIWNYFSANIKALLFFLKKEFGAKKRVIIYSKIVYSDYYLILNNKNFVIDILVDDVFLSLKDLVYYSEFFKLRHSPVLFTSDFFKQHIAKMYLGVSSKISDEKSHFVPPPIKHVVIRSESSCSVIEKKVLIVSSASKLANTFMDFKSGKEEFNPLHIYL